MKPILLFLFVFYNCNTFVNIPEPSLDQTTVRSETVCTEVFILWPFCTKDKSKSVLLKGIFNNSTSEKKYFLEFVPDTADTDIPVGISIYIDGTYYNLKKMSTEYVETIKLSSELSAEIMNKLSNAKNNIRISYSNRTTTFNYSMNTSNSEKLSKQAGVILKQMKSVEILKIVK
jgi:hypothetical protein